MVSITPEMLARAGTEDAIQAAYFCFLSIKMRDPGFELLKWIHAIPNGGDRGSAMAGAKMKATGTRRGVWDICIPFVRGKYHGAYLELKRPIYRNRAHGGLSDEQVEFGLLMHSQGFFMQPVYSWEEARDATLLYWAL